MDGTHRPEYHNPKLKSKFSIDNILGSEAEQKIKTSPTKLSREDGYKRNMILQREKELSETRQSLDIPTRDFRYQQTENWLYRNHFRDEIPKERDTNCMNLYSNDYDRIPSPSSSKECWPALSMDKLCRKPMESWYFDKMNSYNNIRPAYVYEKKEQDRFSQWKYPYPRELEGYHPKYSRLSRYKDFYLLSPTADPDSNNRKPGQVRFSNTQSSELERVFNIQKYISPQERKPLARTLDLSERQVKTWFQNRRAKWRRIKLEDEMRTQLTKTCLPRLDEHIGGKNIDDQTNETK